MKRRERSKGRRRLSGAPNDPGGHCDADPFSNSTASASGFGGRQILSDVSFTVSKGELAAIIGPNGAGKTTLIRLILGLQAPSAGKVLKGRTTMGYVPQKLVIDPDMPLRARDVVSLGLDGHKLGFSLPSKSRREQVSGAARRRRLRLRGRPGGRAIRR